MNISSFFKIVELRTKVASIIPFFIGILFAFYRYNTLNVNLLIILFISMICIDMATTAINNFIDYKKAHFRDGYNYNEHNAIVKFNISETTALLLIFTLLIIGSMFGLILFYLTDWIILIIGIISFTIGILYSYGPVPISRTPLGELFSGIIMGGLIFFITIYVQIIDKEFISINILNSIFYLKVNFVELIKITIPSLPLIFMISNIMLANNICDVNDDVKNKRYTLPYFLGKKLSLILFSTLYLLSYLVIILSVIFKILPIMNLFVLLTLIPVIKNVSLFIKEQNKATTFSFSVKNFILITSSWILTFIIYFIL